VSGPGVLLDRLGLLELLVSLLGGRLEIGELPAQLVELRLLLEAACLELADGPVRFLHRPVGVADELLGHGERLLGLRPAALRGGIRLLRYDVQLGRLGRNGGGRRGREPQRLGQRDRTGHVDPVDARRRQGRGEQSAAHRLGAGPIEHRRRQGGLDLVGDRLGDPDALLQRQGAGLLGDRRRELAPLPRQGTQLRGVHTLLRLAQRVPDRDHLLDLGALTAYEQVDHPRGHRGFPQLLDRGRQLLVRLELLGPRIARRGELVLGQGVELVGDLQQPVAHRVYSSSTGYGSHPACCARPVGVHPRCS
jgi:hypothetical protein